MLPFTIFILAACLFAAPPANASPGNTSPPDQAVRQDLNINRDWKFVLADPPNAQAIDFDDSSWQHIGLPHSFSIPYFLSRDFYVGYGWYRRHLIVPAPAIGKRFFLEFQGVFQDAQIYVNGRPMGEHKGGYTGFSIDITEAIKAGDNLLAVRVNNLWNPQLAPRAGEHVFSGGIYRDVHLLITDPLHVTWYGTFVTTPVVSPDSATVNLKTEIRNDADTDVTAVVENTIVNSAGEPVTKSQSNISVPAHRDVTADQTADPIPHPQLWSPAHPDLYHLHTKIYTSGRLTDTFDTPFGIRSIQFTPEHGFFLNGQHCYLLGANVHQDHAGWGDAITDAAIGRDVAMVKEAGFNFIRGSHYPHAPAFADACDRDGVMLWSENPFWGTGGFASDGYWNSSAYPPLPADQAPFEAGTKQELREMIRIFRNHPSVIAWSMSNEPFFSSPSVMPKVRQLLKDLVALSHQLDPTRPAGIGGCQRGDIDKLGDVAGYNGDGARLFIDPGIPSLVTEYGSVTSDRPGQFDPQWGDLPKGPRPNNSPSFFWRYPWRSGEAIWCMFDHGSIAGSPLGKMGIVDYFRVPKRAWFWYRKEYAHVPPPPWPKKGTPAKLQLTADKTKISGTDATDDIHLLITVLDASGTPISNSPTVRLEIVSGPGEFPTGRSITFAPDSDISIRDGMAAMEFRSYFGGQTVIRATSPGLQPAEITIQTQGTPLFVAGVTPTTPERPYVRFQRSAASAPLVFGLDNPTLASSEMNGHSSRCANDGNPVSEWAPAPSDSAPWWQVDLERVCTLSSVNFTLSADTGSQFSILVSEDGRSWRPALKNAGSKTTPDRSFPLVNSERVRFVRISFENIPPGGRLTVKGFSAIGQIFTPRQ